MKKLDFYGNPIVLGRIYRSVLDISNNTVAFNEETIEAADCKQYIPYEWVNIKAQRSKKQHKRRIDM